MSVVRFSLRDFHSGDFETLWHIDQQCFVPGISYSREELSVYVKVPGSFTLVAETLPADGDSGGKAPDDPEIVGFVVANLNRARAGHIITIDVIPQAQRSGVGSALLRAAEERLDRHGCKWIRLEAAVDNASALSFYKRHHFNVVRTIPGYYPNGVDAFVLKKDLPSAAADR
jgi:ribosomal-protein-alanine N-acetyltransferase